MPITLNHSNISVQYSSDKSYIIETVKSDLYLRNEIYDTIVRDNIQTAPVTPIVSIQEGSNVYAVESYTYSGTANTADFTRVFPKNTVCDILIVGGGGGGSAGGGGAGGYVYNTNITLNGTYSIKTGKGGAGATGSTGGSQGANSSLIGGSISYTAYGGGGGGGNGVIAPAHTTGQVGSYGGSGHDFTTAQTYTSTQGNRGGRAIYNSGGGGGGSGAVGNDGSVFFNNLFSQTGVVYYYRGGQGGIGLSNNITGSDVYYAGGGTGGVNTNRDTDTSPHELVLGGGGIGARAPNANGGNGTNGLGGGGGGGDWERTAGTTGGSGIVIIRYLVGTIPTNNLLTEPTVISPAMTESIRTFVHSGGTEAQTTHTITVGQNTICDILIIGGGGAGGTYIGGGGGAGGVLYIQNATVPSGTYNIQIGKGGTGFNGMGNSTTAQNGSSSKAFGIEVFGGGYGGSGGWGTGGTGQTGGSGGSSGGGGSTYTTSVSFGSGGSIIQPSFTSSLIKVNTYNYYGGNGAAGYRHSGSGGGVGSNGGGGAGGNAPANTNESNAGNGADGIAINITGTSYFWGGGGGGGQYAGSKAGNGGKGGGGGGNGSESTEGVGIGGTGGITLGQDGDPEGDGTPTAGNGGAGTGGGGGGTGRTTGSPNAISGSGGSGIVIIKFKSIVGAGILDGITHKRLNFVYEQKYPTISVDNTNLKAWYKFDGNYEDSSGNNNNLTNANATLTTAFIGDGVYFDSTGDIVKTLNNFPLFNMTSRMSISCWVKRTALSANRDFIWGQGPSNALTQFGGTFVEDNKITFYIYSHIEIRPTTTFTNTTIFNHIVYTIGDGIAKIYLNGVELGSASYTNVNIPAAPLFIGKQTPTEGTSTCVIDDFRYYGKVLTPTEISQLYNIPTQNTYTINFPVPTIADINNNSNIVLRGAYDIALSTSNALIIPKTGQYIPKPTTFATDLLSIRYNILNPLNDPIGAQLTYSSNNTNVYHMGSVGIGTTSPEYQLDVSGSVNAKSYYLNGRQINEPLSELGLSEGMIAQVRHLTYTQMDVKNNTGWDAINDNLTTGFVIAITPKSNLSKILLNIIVHIGLAATSYSVWWGIKLYRKIGSSDWTEVTGPNGTETGSAAATAGTPVWISNTMYAGDLDYTYKVTNVTGTYLDSPNTTSTVYYTAYWSNRLGDNPSAINTIYLNRAENHGDAYRPAPSSSWTASEIWYG